MSTINDLAVSSSVDTDDKLPIWSSKNGVTRALPISVFDSRYPSNADFSRALVFPKSDYNPQTTLPIASARANKAFFFDSAGNPIAVDMTVLGLAAPVVHSIAALRLVSKLIAVDVFVLGYYAARDGGGGAYCLDPTDTTSADNGGTIIVAADGGRWKLSATQSLSVRQFGAKGDHVTDDTIAILAFAAAIQGRQGFIPAGYYLCNSVINWPDGSIFELEIEAGATVDFSGATPTDGTLMIGTDAGGLTALPTLGANVTKGDASFTFASPPALSQGDIYILCNTTPYSWLNIQGSTPRPYYLAGEFSRARSISGNVVTNDRRSFDNYAVGANMQAWKLTTSTVKIHGKGTLIFSPNTSNVTAQINSGILIYNGYGCEVSGLIITGANRANVDLRRCYSTRVHHITVNDYSADVGLNYGVSTIACFDCHVSDSTLHTTRHGVTLTGGSITGSIPNRFCSVHDSTLISDFLALDMHGAVEYCSFIDCKVYGGVDIAGDHSTVRGLKIWTSYSTLGQLGVGIRVREILGANHTIEDVTIIIMDAVVAGTDAPLALNLKDQYSVITGLRGGELRVSNLTIESNVAISIGARISIPGSSTGTVKLSMDGVSAIRPSGTGAPLINVSSDVGGYFESIAMKNMDGVVPFVPAAASRIKIAVVENSSSPNHGVYVAPQSVSGLSQRIEVDVCSVSKAMQAGVLISGPNMTDDIIATVSMCKPLDNNQNGAGTTTRYKASIALENLKQATLKYNQLGDTQATMTQLYYYTATNIGTLTEVSNEKVGGVLGKQQTNVTTIVTTFPTI